MTYNTSSKVEEYFQKLDASFADNKKCCRTETLIVDNYIVLGQLTALRFIEWVGLNPGGVVALPTGKTPEFFIKWLMYYMENWNKEAKSGIIKKLGLKKPDFSSLHFFQLNEFLPMNPNHSHSYHHFVKTYYIDLLGFDPEKTHLLNTYYLNEQEQEELGGAKNLGEIFTDGKIDLSLRTRIPQTKEEQFKKRAIKIFDAFCMNYEQKIRDLGGIGFFLGGIGPDGGIAFNVKGSSPYSHTRLTGINYETQASSAGDLGGINIVRKKAVITMGLETITCNPDCVAIIIAAGQSKADVVAGSVLNPLTQDYPATSLQKLKNARFFATQAAASLLPQSHKFMEGKYPKQMVPQPVVERLIVDEVLKVGRNIPELIKENYTNDQLKFVAKLTGKTVKALLKQTEESLKEKIRRGLITKANEVILHTAPHHDDIELGYFPYIHHLVRTQSVENHFAICTSGYTSVVSPYLKSVYEHILERINPNVAAFRDENLVSLFKTTAQDDLTLYLRGVALQDQSRQDYAVARRIARRWVEKNGYKTIDELQQFIQGQYDILCTTEQGDDEPDEFHTAKGWLREMEAESVWAHFGIGMDRVSHLHLPFYSGGMFPRYPEFKDVGAAIDLLEKIKPTVVTLALDPEGSGPDTHFKTLIALNIALKEYKRNHPEINLRVWGYRNVWSTYHISEVNTAVPVSLNSFAVLHNMFQTCYLSQKSADFPSPTLDGPFSEVAQKVWVSQHNDLCRLLGEEYFYKSDSMMLQRSYGNIYIKDMTFDEFQAYMQPVQDLLAAMDSMKPKK